MVQLNTDPRLGNVETNEARSPVHHVKYIVTTYAISILRCSPISYLRSQIKPSRRLVAALLTSLELILMIHFTFDNDMCSYGILGEEASDDVKIVLLVVANIFLWIAAGVAWMLVSRGGPLRLERHLYMLVRPHIVREDEGPADVVFKEERQDMV